MMAAYITAPGYRPEALERFHQGLASLYLNLTRTPGGVMQSQVSRFLRDGDPRFGVPDQDDAAKRTLDELKAWLAEPLAASYMEVSIVGDFDPEAALKAVNSTLGSLAPRAAAKPAYAEQRKVRFPSERKLKTFTFDARDPKAYATVYWPTTDFSHTSDVRRLFVLAKVLEGRILERIRIQEGLSYTAQGGNSPSTAFPQVWTAVRSGRRASGQSSDAGAGNTRYRRWDRARGRHQGRTGAGAQPAGERAEEDAERQQLPDVVNCLRIAGATRAC